MRKKDASTTMRKRKVPSAGRSRQQTIRVEDLPAIKLKFWSCPIAEESVIRSLVQKQVEVMQKSYRGEATCEDPIYDIPKVDTGLRFLPYEEGDVTILEGGELCDTCDDTYMKMWKKF